MCQTNLAGLWIGTTSDEGNLRNRVVRRAEGALGNERTVALQLARYRVNLCRL